MIPIRKKYLELISSKVSEFDLGKVFPNSDDLDTLVSTLEDLRDCIDSFRPLDQTQSKNLLEALDIEYTYESNRIEGNTLTLQETALVINKGLTISGKSLKEHLEAKNHSNSINYIREIAQDEIDITVDLLHKIHNLVLASIDPTNAGKFRNIQVMISGSRHSPPNPELVPELIRDMITFYNQHSGLIPDVILAADMHRKFVNIHPYVDGNGRTARLLMNLILIRNGYPVANIKGDSESRQFYYKTLQLADDTDDYEPFQLFIAKTVRASCIQWLKLISVNTSCDKGEIFFEHIESHLPKTKIT